MVTILFWVVLAPIAYPQLPHTYEGFVIGAKLFLIHVVPFGACFADLYMCDIQFIE